MHIEDTNRLSKGEASSENVHQVLHSIRRFPTLGLHRVRIKVRIHWSVNRWDSIKLYQSHKLYFGRYEQVKGHDNLHCVKNTSLEDINRVMDRKVRPTPVNLLPPQWSQYLLTHSQWYTVHLAIFPRIVHLYLHIQWSLYCQKCIWST